MTDKIENGIFYICPVLSCKLYIFKNFCYSCPDNPKRFIIGKGTMNARFLQQIKTTGNNRRLVASDTSRCLVIYVLA